MAVIDRDGLLSGERLGKCSDLAQFMWPRLYVAANSVVRLELDYDKLLSTAFKSLHTKPSREQFATIIKEYYKNYLLFIYQPKDHPGIWGQFATDKKNLPRYTRNDSANSPAPDAKAFAKWMDTYATEKAARAAQTFADELAHSRRLTVNHSESPCVDVTHINSPTGSCSSSCSSGSGNTPLPPNAGWKPIEAAMYVGNELDIAGKRERDELAATIELRQKKHGGEAGQVAEQMVEAWRRYSAVKREITHGVVKFFTTGLWLKPDSWPPPIRGAPPPVSGPNPAEEMRARRGTKPCVTTSIDSS